MKKNYDLSALMSLAWEIFRKPKNEGITFSKALKRAWACFDVGDENRKAREDAYVASGLTEEVRTYTGWLDIGRRVMHEQKAVFQVVYKTPERGLGKTYTVSFFAYSQTDLAENVA